MFRKTMSTLTTSELQIVVAQNLLNKGYVAIQGGEEIAKWLEDHMKQVKGVFGGDDRIYIGVDTPDTARQLVQFIKEHDIGDERLWIKPTDSETWWLEIWWD